LIFWGILFSSLNIKTFQFEPNTLKILFFKKSTLLVLFFLIIIFSFSKASSLILWINVLLTLVAFRFQENTHIWLFCFLIVMYYIYRGFKVFYNRRYFLNFRRYLKKNRLRAVRGPGGGSSWNLAFFGPKNVLQRLQNIKCFWKKNPINFRVQISPRVKTMHNAWISPPPNFFIEYFSLQTSAKIIHR
jgi:hypothetical protein